MNLTYVLPLGILSPSLNVLFIVAAEGVWCVRVMCNKICSWSIRETMLHLQSFSSEDRGGGAGL